MDTHILLLAVIALVGLGVMLIGFGSEITGQGVNLIKLPAETQKSIISQVGKGSQAPSDPCGCKGLYGGNIATIDSDLGFAGLAGLSNFDCILVDEIIKLRKELKLDTTSADQFKVFCKAAGW